MKTVLKRVITVVLCFAMVITTSLYAAAASESQLRNDIAALQQEAKEIQSEINRLKSEKQDQEAVLGAIRKKIANTQAQIDRCNQEIASINSKISANKAEIESKQSEIADDIFEYKKRLSAMYMTGSGNNIQILLGAEDFSDFLRLSQFTSSMSVRDKKLIEGLKSEIEVLNQKNAENEELLNSQVSIKSTISAQQAELEAQENDAAAIYNSIASEQAANQDDLDDVNAEVKKLQKQLEDAIASSSKGYSSFVNPNTGLQWPVSGFLGISAGFKSNDAVHKGKHNGIDIAGGGIAGQPIRAIADGYVTLVSNSCTHNSKKSGNCCGNGYGNYATINHGSLNINGSTANYVAYYAHAQRIIVSTGQYVKQGDIIGYVGTTGWSTGYHLHLGILKNGSWINPYPLFF